MERADGLVTADHLGRALVPGAEPANEPVEPPAGGDSEPETGSGVPESPESDETGKKAPGTDDDTKEPGKGGSRRGKS